MKNIHYLLFAIFISLNFSCSKNDGPEVFEKYKFKVSYKFSGDYINYKILCGVNGSTDGHWALMKNSITGEPSPHTLTPYMTEDTYEVESVNSIIGFNTILNSIANTDTFEKNAFVDITIYRDGKAIIKENLVFTPKAANNIGWAYIDGEIIRADGDTGQTRIKI